MPTILQPIRRFAETRPDATALSFNGQDYSYAAMLEAVERLRGSLVERNIGRGDAVAIVLPSCPHFVISHLAVLSLGAITVPINVLQKAGEISRQIDDAEACALIGWSNLAAEAEKAANHSESLRHRFYLGDVTPGGTENLLNLVANGSRLVEDVAADDGDLAAIVYTPGTSGRPRGIELTHGNFLTHADELGRLLRIRGTDRFVSAIPLSSIAALTGVVHLALTHGAEIRIHSRFHPGDALECLHESRATVFLGNPSAYALMSRFPSPEKYDLSTLRYALSCESKLPDETAQSMEDQFRVRVFEGYSSTETCGLLTLNLFPQISPRGSVGQPIGQHEVMILDNDLKPVHSSTTGRIAFRGPALTRGYHKRPEKTRQSFLDQWFVSSDRGYLDGQAHLFVATHDDELIIKGGFPVYSREIEAVVEGLPHVQEAAVVGVPDSVYGQEIRAYVVLKEGASIGPSEIIEYVKERVAIYKCPKIVRLVKELPKTPSGKIIRTQLQEENP